MLTNHPLFNWPLITDSQQQPISDHRTQFSSSFSALSSVITPTCNWTGSDPQRDSPLQIILQIKVFTVSNHSFLCWHFCLVWIFIYLSPPIRSLIIFNLIEGPPYSNRTLTNFACNDATIRGIRGWNYNIFSGIIQLNSHHYLTSWEPTVPLGHSISPCQRLDGGPSLRHFLQLSNSFWRTSSSPHYTTSDAYHKDVRSEAQKTLNCIFTINQIFWKPFGVLFIECGNHCSTSWCRRFFCLCVVFID